MTSKKYYCNKQEFEFAVTNIVALTVAQITEIRKPTPPEEIKIETDDNGNEYKTVSGNYIKRKLNIIFGWDWDFQIIDKERYSGEVMVTGRLTIRTNDKTIIREQFGGHKLINQTSSDSNITRSYAINISDAFKSAATNSLKKCSSEIGMCWDIFNQKRPDKPTTNKSKLSYDEQKILDKLKFFLDKCKNIEQLETTFEEWEEKVGKENITKEMTSLLNDYIEATNKLSEDNAQAVNADGHRLFSK